MERLRASDIMNRNVIQVTPDRFLTDVVHLLLDNDANAVVVVDDDDEIVGIVSEGDFIHRPETETDGKPAWWISLFADSATLARQYVKRHGRRAADVMTSPAVTVTADTPLLDVADVFDKYNVRQVPVTAKDRLVGLISRRDILRALANKFDASAPSCDDATINAILQKRLSAATWTHQTLVHASVRDGVVDLEGWIMSPSERRALQIAAETIPGVRAVEDHLRNLDVAGRQD
jgi:CBS domain-containing protein